MIKYDTTAQMAVCRTGRSESIVPSARLQREEREKGDGTTGQGVGPSAQAQRLPGRWGLAGLLRSTTMRWYTWLTMKRAQSGWSWFTSERSRSSNAVNSVSGSSTSDCSAASSAAEREHGIGKDAGPG